jgi:cation transport ATPase
MATRKQRKRREKELRHEYVWVDDDGNEVEAEGDPARSAGTGSKSKPARGGRTVHPPSWRKSFKRGAIFAPIMLVTVMLLSKNLTLSQQVTQALFIVVVFIPFSYFLDRMFYRSFQKRSMKGRATGGKSGS